MNSQDKLGLTVCYRTDDEDDIGIYISEVCGPIFLSRPKGCFCPFYVLTNLSFSSSRSLWKDTDELLRPFITLGGVLSSRGVKFQCHHIRQNYPREACESAIKWSRLHGFVCSTPRERQIHISQLMFIEWNGKWNHLRFVKALSHFFFLFVSVECIECIS